MGEEVEQEPETILDGPSPTLVRRVYTTACMPMSLSFKVRRGKVRKGKARRGKARRFKTR